MGVIYRTLDESDELSMDQASISTIEFPFDWAVRQWDDTADYLTDFPAYLNKWLENKPHPPSTAFCVRFIASELSRLLGVAQKITEKRKSYSDSDVNEETGELEDSLEDLDVDVRSELSAKVCDHDLNNVLTGAVGNLDLYAGRLRELRSSAKKDLILSASHVRYTLSIARFIETGDIESLDQISLNAMVELLGNINRINIINEIREAVFIDPLIYGTLYNFEANAKDNLGVTRDKKLNNRAQLKFTYDGEAQTLYATVTDKGSGIEIYQTLPQIFEYGFTTESSKTRTNTGLGLYLAKQAVDAHNGYIKVETRHRSGHATYCTGSLETETEILSTQPQQETGTTFKLAIPVVEVTEGLIIPKIYEETFKQREQQMQEAAEQRFE